MHFITKTVKIRLSAYFRAKYALEIQYKEMGDTVTSIP